jgi:hypothetical protein
MNNVERPLTRSWFFYFMAVYTGLEMIWFGVLVFDFVTHPVAPDIRTGSVAFRLLLGLGIVPLALIVTGMVLRRASSNVTGLFLLQMTVIIMAGTLRQGSPLIVYDQQLNFGWLGIWLLPLFFPNGRAAPVQLERWGRLLGVTMVIMGAILGVSQPTVRMFDLARQQIFYVPNPIFIPVLGTLQPLIEVVESILLLPTGLVILPSIVLRYRSGDHYIRQQIKWLTWIVALFILMVLVLGPIGLLTDSFKFGTPGLVIMMMFTLYCYLAPYIAVGNAILRHRLYDIDIIIRRTLIYTILTIILAVVYFGNVVLVQQVFRAATGQSSDLAIVISTLAIAALFSPLRRRIQDVIDRRLYRRKYDAQKTLETFNRTMRDEVDLDQLSAQLIAVVQATMQPTQITLWLNKSSKDEYR